MGTDERTYIKNKKGELNGNWIDLSGLPRWSKLGHGRIGSINWKESNGCKVKFKYKDIEDELKIVDYDINTQMLVVKYKDNDVFEIHSSGILKCKLGKLLGLTTNEFRHKIGEVFKDGKRNLTIVDREYRFSECNKQNKKYYQYTCNKCGYDHGWINEGNLKAGDGCSACGKNIKIAVLGINTIYDTNPEMIKLGISEEDTKKYTRGSDKRVTVICPDCNTNKNMPINKIYARKSISCNNCSDGFPYTEKFTYSVLNQLKVKFEVQLSKGNFDWCDKYRYDFYFEYNDEKYIVETHGRQHYEEVGSIYKSLLEERLNDKLKYRLAISNGIKTRNYIVVDCRESNMEFIKNNILNSRLAEIFDLSNVDWLKCEEFALKSLVKEVCNYWNNKEDWETIADLVKVFNISRSAVLKYLKQGTKIKWCSYDSKIETYRNNNRAKDTGKRILAFEKGVFIGLFKSAAGISNCSEELFGVKMKGVNINIVASMNHNRYGRPYKGHTFKYVQDLTPEEYIKYNIAEKLKKLNTQNES